MPATRLTTALMLLLLSAPLVSAGPLTAVAGNGPLDVVSAIERRAAEFSSRLDGQENGTEFAEKVATLHAHISPLLEEIVSIISPNNYVCVTFALDDLNINIPPSLRTVDLIGTASGGVPGIGYENMDTGGRYGQGYYDVGVYSAPVGSCNLLGPIFNPPPSILK